jgi:hypothetical protein
LALEKHPSQLYPGNVFFRNTPQAICWLDPSARIIATTLAFDRLLPEGAAALFPAGTGTTWNAFWSSLQLSGTGTAGVERSVACQAATVLKISGEVLQMEGETSPACSAPM